MTHKYRHRQIERIKKKYKNLAGIVAAATILSTAVLPGMPSTIAHASASPNAGTTAVSTSQQSARTNQSSSQINLNAAASPTKEVNPIDKTSQSSGNKAPLATSNPTKETKQGEKTSATTSKTTKEANPNVQPDPNAEKAPATTSKTTKEANPNVQPDPNAEKTPATTSKTTKEANPNVQPDPNAEKAPAITSTTTKEANPNVQPDPNAERTSPNTPPTNYKEVLDISATAYAPGPHDNGQWGNKTHIGTEVRPGIIAVDPKVIPLGSRVYIEYPDGHGEYAIAEDTGGAIKGNRVDVAKWTVNEAQNFGIQKVKVYVVSTPKDV